MNFINKLKQTVCFNILSVSGYLLIIFWLFGHFVLFPYDYEHSLDKEMGGIDALAFIVLATSYYYLFFIIMLIAGFIEFYVKNKLSKFNAAKTNLYTFIFITGIAIPGIPLFMYYLFIL